MSKGYGFREAALRYVVLGEDVSWVTAERFWLSLHVTDPVAGNQTTAEATYTGYARQSIDRDELAWTIAVAGAKNVDTITFPTPTGGTGEELNYVGIGLNETGAGTLLYSGNTMETIYTVTLPPIIIPPEGLWLREL